MTDAEYNEYLKYNVTDVEFQVVGFGSVIFYGFDGVITLTNKFVGCIHCADHSSKWFDGSQFISNSYMAFD